MPILKEVQKLASQLIDEDPKLEKKENKLLKEMVKEKFHDRLEI